MRGESFCLIYFTFHFSTTITSLVPTLQKVVAVSELMFHEEKHEYLSFMQRNCSHPLAALHSEAVYQKALCKYVSFFALLLVYYIFTLLFRLMEHGCSPIASDLSMRYTQLQDKVSPSSYLPFLSHYIALLFF